MGTTQGRRWGAWRGLGNPMVAGLGTTRGQSRPRPTLRGRTRSRRAVCDCRAPQRRCIAASITSVIAAIATA